MEDSILFADRDTFRIWLSENHSVNNGIWLIFGKKDGPKTLTPDEAVEHEAIRYRRMVICLCPNSTTCNDSRRCE
jgi:hypothetical protein